MELDKLGVIVEDRLPDPAPAGYGQLTHELFSMLAFAAEAPGPGSMSRALGPLWDYLAAMDRRDRFMAARDRPPPECVSGPAPVQLAAGCRQQPRARSSPVTPSTCAASRPY